MRSNRHRSLLGVTLLGALAVAACGGSTPTTTGTPAAGTAAPTAAAATAPGTTTPSISTSSPPTPQPSAASLPPAPTPAGTAAATPGASIDIGGAVANLEGVSRYKVVVTLTGGTGAGTATFVTVREPVLARSFEGNFGGAPTRVIIIGTDVWVDSGAGQWVKNVIPLVVAEGMMTAFDPAILFLGIGAWTNSGGLVRVGTEDKNGVRAVHYHLDSTTVPPGSTITDDAVIDLWVAEEGGYLVSMRTTGVSNPGGPDTIEMDLSNIDDPALTIVAPT